MEIYKNEQEEAYYGVIDFLNTGKEMLMQNAPDLSDFEKGQLRMIRATLDLMNSLMVDWDGET
jgi:capsid protein